MQDKTHDFLYVQLFNSHKSSLKISKVNKFSTENNSLLIRFYKKNNLSKLLLQSHYSDGIIFKLKQNSISRDLLNLLSDLLRCRKQGGVVPRSNRKY